jgi:hypothetical protein
MWRLSQSTLIRCHTWRELNYYLAPTGVSPGVIRTIQSTMKHVREGQACRQAPVVLQEAGVVSARDWESF